jgi:predicted glycogen debranching enzyme
MLIAALAAPWGRTVMLSRVMEHVQLPDGRQFELGARSGDVADPPKAGDLTEFRLELGLPVWRYDLDGCVLEKRVFLPHMQNTVIVMYETKNVDSIDVAPGAELMELTLGPAVNFRPQVLPVSEPLGWPYELKALEDTFEITLARSAFPPLRVALSVCGSAASGRTTRPTFTIDGQRIETVLYPVEESRGYQGRGDLWCPGGFRCPLAVEGRITLVASTESHETFNVLAPEVRLDAERVRRRGLVAQANPDARNGVAAELVISTDQFIVAPAGRDENAVRAHAFGDDVRTIYAGYHWFTDWGRDTMISLEGLTLATGRYAEAGWILRTFARFVRNGLIPNLFPEGQTEGQYHTADATLWFFHAIDRYVEASGDRLTLALLFPTLERIVDAHLNGTLFGIRVDDRDGLLTQGAPGCPLTWMDAKVDDWVVTPRRGKAVEINALWFNALKLMERWAGEFGPRRASDFARQSDQVRRAFNERFWFSDGEYLFDVVDDEGGDDVKFRPNQIFSIALPHPVLARERWEPVVRNVRNRLLTPLGLRSLAPGDPDYKQRYFGDLRARDAAYHQGTVWAWLAGPFVDAWLKVYPDDLQGARAVLEGFPAHLNDACIGSISEVFDAEAPFTPRGCVAQAWSVAEVLRASLTLVRVARRPPGDPAARALR